MIVPTVHLNGTSRDELLKQLTDASEALDAAYNMLKKANPNGRDYYPQGTDVIYKAIEEHMSRLRKIDEVKEEIDELTRRVADPVGS